MEQAEGTLPRGEKGDVEHTVRLSPFCKTNAKKNEFKIQIALMKLIILSRRVPLSSWYARTLCRTNNATLGSKEYT